MLAIKTNYEHIILEKNIPFIAGTGTKVIELVLNSKAYGWSPEELHFQHPHLTLGQIYSALAYYWDHKEELENDIERRLNRVERIKRTIVAPTKLAHRLKANSCT